MNSFTESPAASAPHPIVVRLKRLRKWLHPGMGVKRWGLMVFGGVGLTSLGVAIARDLDLAWPVIEFLYKVTNQLVPHTVSGGVIAFIGLILVAVGVRQTVRSIAAVLAPDDKPLVDVIYEKRQLERGYRVVVIGGGTGLSVLLRGIKKHTSNITAVVNVADDGGSSGRLRERGYAPPGDIRNCLVALADVEPLMEELFQYRFSGMGSDLDGHSFGNLFIAALTDVTGNFEKAVEATSKVLSIRGRVLPATLEDVKLGARLENGQVIIGQTKVNQATSPIERAFLEPACPHPLPEVLEAIRDAEVIVIGPGSLYSSIMPNLLVPQIAAAVQASKALKIYVCNVMTQPRETLGYTASDHVRAIMRHAGEGLIDFVLVNTKKPSTPVLERYRQAGADYVEPDIENITALGMTPITGDFINETLVVRHDSQKLADAIFLLVEQSRR
ncbi:MAG: YvcK family protein [Abditibacteriales bacterium]|nr:YvcK family protein [Abditibacteriales bacterium]MDW8365460.1 YvcK family protein [Abditibacteriales bacterium]